MQEGGKILSDVMKKTLERALPGVKTIELEHFADCEIKKAGAEASFRTVHHYPFATCMCVNNVVVHGLPGDYILKEGDVLGVDCGVLYKGWHTDMSWTILVQNSKFQIPNSKQIQNSNDKNSKQTGVETHHDASCPEEQAATDVKEETTKQVSAIEQWNNRTVFLKIGQEALEAAIKVAKIGNYVWDISRAIQDVIEKKGGYHSVRALTGHGIGRILHEDPFIPCFIEGKREKSAKLCEGMTLAIEVIYAEGTAKVWYENHDGWTITTRDGSLSGLFEATIAIVDTGCIILTPTCELKQFLL